MDINFNSGLTIEQIELMDKQLLDENGIIKLIPAHCYDKLDFEELRAWLHYRAAYGIPTTELINWINQYLGHWKKRTIEIGSGNGWLCHHLDIPGFDSKFQNKKEIRLLYGQQGQPTIKYPEFVKEGECVDVVNRHKPHTVLLSWMTQKVYKNDSTSKQGCFGGIDYELLLSKVKQIVLIGSEEIHGKFDIMRISHSEIREDWIKSRRNDNCIYIWSNKKWKP